MDLSGPSWLLRIAVVALMTYQPLGFIGIAAFFLFVFLPNMIRKDKLLSMYPGFVDYKRKTGFFFPSIFQD